MGRRHRCLRFAAIAAALLGLALPATVAAHPLGNFTINHFAELRVAPDRIDVDVVLDMAEIPTFQERQGMDADEDGSVSDAETADWASARCISLARELDLRVAGTTTPLNSTASTVSFPAARRRPLDASTRVPLRGPTDLTARTGTRRDHLR